MAGGGGGVGMRLRGGGGKSSAAVVKMYGDLDASTAIGGGGGGKMTPNNVSQYLPRGTSINNVHTEVGGGVDSRVREVAYHRSEPNMDKVLKKMMDVIDGWPRVSSSHRIISEVLRLTKV